MNIIQTDIEGVVIIEPKVFADDRGYFFESFSQQRFIENICSTTFVQDNESKSTYGVLRGLHFQKPPYAQSKLVRVVSGAVWDVAVDIREGSPTFARGFAHGFVVLSPEAVFQYKCDAYYAPAHEGSVLWSDGTIAIDWKIPTKDVILSAKDKQSPLLKDAWLFDYKEKLY